MKTIALSQDGGETVKSSLNQVPSAIKNLSKYVPFEGHMYVLNFGCGRYPQKAEDCLAEQGAEVVNFDPYVLHPCVFRSLRNVTRRAYDVVLCCNVLNVTKDLEATLNELSFVESQYVVIQIYEGDKSGEGRETNYGGWQWNCRAEDYRKIIGHFFIDAERVDLKGNVYVIKRY